MRSVNKPGAELFSAGSAAASWRKSSRCSHGDCLEAGSLAAGTVAVRDTKDHGTGPRLIFRPAAWRSFIADVKHGRAAIS